jgi:hypothetical protein
MQEQFESMKFKYLLDSTAEVEHSAEKALNESTHGFRYLYGGAPTRKARRLARALLKAKKACLRARDRENVWQQEQVTTAMSKA